MQERNIPLIRYDELVVVKPLGQGEYGIVYRGVYKGKDVAVKEFKDKPDLNEIDIWQAIKQGQHVEYIKKEEKESEVSFIKKQALIMPFIAFDADGSSGDLTTFFYHLRDNTYYGNHPQIFEGDGITQVFNANHLAITLTQLAFSMKQQQNAIHDLGYFHLDTSARNYLVNQPIYTESGPLLCAVTLTDFGLSRRIPDNGVIDISEMQGKRPGRIMDLHFLKKGKCTIATDLFALKAAIITMLGMALGSNETDILLVPQDDGTVPSFKATLKNYKSDSQRLALYLANVSKLAEKTDDFRSKQVQIFIECFREYLTTVPDGSKLKNRDDLYNAKGIDNALFLEATEKFKLSVNSGSAFLSERIDAIPQDFPRNVHVESDFEEANRSDERELSYSNDESGDSIEARNPTLSDEKSNSQYMDIIVKDESDEEPKKARTLQEESGSQQYMDIVINESSESNETRKEEEELQEESESDLTSSMDSLLSSEESGDSVTIPRRRLDESGDEENTPYIERKSNRLHSKLSRAHHSFATHAGRIFAPSSFKTKKFLEDVRDFVNDEDRLNEFTHDHISKKIFAIQNIFLGCDDLNRLNNTELENLLDQVHKIIDSAQMKHEIMKGFYEAIKDNDQKGLRKLMKEHHIVRSSHHK